MRLRNRLFISLAAVAIAFAVTGYLIANTQSRYLRQQVDRQLQNSVRVALSVLGDRPAGPDTDAAGTLTELYVGHLGADGTLTTVLQGALVSGQPQVSVQTAQSLSGPGFGTPFTVDGKGTNDRFRVVAFQRRDQPGFDIVALSLAKTDDAYNRLVLALSLGGLGVLAVIVLTGLWVVRLGVRPINEVTAAADAIMAGDKARRVPSFPARTEAAHLANAFNSMLDQRQAADDRLRQFVADASHELRTPLTSIRGYTDLYQQGGLRDEARLDDAMRRVNAEADRMSAIVNDLLLLSKLDRGTALEVEEVDVGGLLADAAADARAVQPERAITVDVEGGRPLSCVADPGRLHQVVAAIMHNALMYTPVDTPIEIKGSRQDGAVVIDIVDHGPGMDQATAEHAFERFFRGDPSRARHTGGSGLGLSIAQSIVEAHQGRIALITAPGQGCRFRIALPAGSARSISRPAAESAPEGT